MVPELNSAVDRVSEEQPAFKGKTEQEVRYGCMREEELPRREEEYMSSVSGEGGRVSRRKEMYEKCSCCAEEVGKPRKVRPPHLWGTR